MKQLPKLILTDIDGVWTDGGMYYSSNGDELKKFNTYDSAGVLLSHALNIPVGIITGEKSVMVERRAKKLKVDFCYIDVHDKVEVALEISSKLGISLKEVAYIGDDINDIKLLKQVGFSGTVPSSADYVKKLVNYTTKVKGGDGAFRDFVEFILMQNNCLELALENIINK